MTPPPGDGPGEVHTPLRGPDADPLADGDLSHSGTGGRRAVPHVHELHTRTADSLVSAVRTHRGEGRPFG